ncbi:MAG: hypothetical protein ACKVG0_00575 [Alphaproteobacteria bacterium]
MRDKKKNTKGGYGIANGKIWIVTRHECPIIEFEAVLYGEHKMIASVAGIECNIGRGMARLDLNLY